MIIRPDLTFLIFLLSHYLSNLEKKHILLLANIFYYISGTQNIKLTFSDNDSDKVIKYSDTDFTEAVDDRKLTKDFVFMLAEECISHQSKWQSVVTLLICESEYMTMLEADKKVI